MFESRSCVHSTKRQTDIASGYRRERRSALGTEVGQERTSTGVVVLVDGAESSEDRLYGTVRVLNPFIGFALARSYLPV